MPRNLGKRVALVIGVEDYESLRSLQNPIADARAVSKALGDLGFQLIAGEDEEDFIRDPERDEALDARERFLDEIRDADIALFYFSGHGVQVDGANYLLLKDSRLPRKALLPEVTLPLSTVLDRMVRRARHSIVILDACRNDPFEGNFFYDEDDNAKGPSTAPSGLSQVALPKTDDVKFARTVHAVFATGSGATAADSLKGPGAALAGDFKNHSPFTAALLKHIATEGQSITDMMGDVSSTLQIWTNYTQKPWYGWLPGAPVRLNPRDDQLPPQNPKPPPPIWDPPVDPPVPRETRYWPLVTGGALLIAATAAAIWWFSTPKPDIPPPQSATCGVPSADKASPDSPDLTTALAKVRDVDSKDDGRRRQTVAALETSLTGDKGLAAGERKRLATAIAQLLLKPARTALSSEGRINVLYLLAAIDPARWQEADWYGVRAIVRRGLVDMQADAAAGVMSIGDRTQKSIDTVRGRVFSPAETSTTVVNFSNKDNGGSLTRPDAEAIRAALASLGWAASGPDGAKETTAAAGSLNVVRYGVEADRPVAQRLTSDLCALGVPMSDPVRNPTINGKPIEVWVSKPIGAGR